MAPSSPLLYRSKVVFPCRELLLLFLPQKPHREPAEVQGSVSNLDTDTHTHTNKRPDDARNCPLSFDPKKRQKEREAEMEEAEEEVKRGQQVAFTPEEGTCELS